MGNINGLAAIRSAAWLVPAATAVHFLEEAPSFARWARRHISPRYTGTHWRKIHGLGMVYAVAFAAAVSLWPNRVLVFLFSAFCLTPMLFNMVFHVIASVLYRSYSPGVVSAVLLYPVLFWQLASLFAGEGLLPTGAGMVAIAVGAIVHAGDLASTTFFWSWPKPPSS